MGGLCRFAFLREVVITVETKKNMDKCKAYQTMKDNLSKAMRSEFYYQAIFIEYAIIEDRCLSALVHAGVKYQDSRGNELSLARKIEKMRKNPAFTNSYVRERITEELLDQILEWKRERDRLIHALAKIPYDNEYVKNVAEQGKELVRVLDNKVKSINLFFERMR